MPGSSVVCRSKTDSSTFPAMRLIRILSDRLRLEADEIPGSFRMEGLRFTRTYANLRLGLAGDDPKGLSCRLWRGHCW